MIAKMRLQFLEFGHIKKNGNAFSFFQSMFFDRLKTIYTSYLVINVIQKLVYLMGKMQRLKNFLNYHTVNFLDPPTRGENFHRKPDGSVARKTQRGVFVSIL